MQRLPPPALTRKGRRWLCSKGHSDLDPFFKISEVPKFHTKRSSSFTTHCNSCSSLRNPSEVVISVTMKHYAVYLDWKLCILCILFQLSLFVVTRQVGVEGGGWRLTHRAEIGALITVRPHGNRDLLKKICQPS